VGDNKYKIIVFGKKLYKEIELPSEDCKLRLGTTKGCQVRFNKDMFFEDFEVLVTRSSGSWSISCGDNLSFITDGIMKLSSKKLQHGDEIAVKYNNIANIELFRINFIVDFDGIEKNYERVVDLDYQKAINIGGNDSCDICISDSLLGKDSITFSGSDGEYTIIDNNSKYGVYINGSKVDHSAKLKDFDFFDIVGYSFYVKNGKLYTSKSKNINVRTLNYIDKSDQQSSFQYPKFNRTTRIEFKIPEEPIEVLPPERLSEPPKANIIIQLIPAIAMIGLTVVLRGFMASGGSFVIYSVAVMTLGIVTSILGIINDKKQYKKSLVDRERKYNEYIKRKEKEIETARLEELEVLKKIYKPAEDLIEDVEKFNGNLFDRDKEDKDFLQVRIGTGVSNAIREVKYKKQESISLNDPLMELPEDLVNRYKFINKAPIISKLAEASAVGVVGDKSQQNKLLKNITLDIAIRHFYNEVKMFYLFDEEDGMNFSWVRWLLHVDNDYLSSRNIVCDEESKNILFEQLYIELSKRESSSDRRSNKAYDKYYIIFVLDNKGINNHPISKYIENAKDFGFTFIFFEASEELLPRGCSEIIRLDDSADSGQLLLSDNGETAIGFSYTPVSDKIAQDIALKLASVYVDEISLESELTKNISLFELLNIMSADDLDIGKRWSSSEVYNSMAAPLGVKTKNTHVYLDLNEKKHGPHGLVAGTTGAGKSEIIQSYILSMATLFHPYEVGFVIIDFKGGGVVNQFKELPHLMGAITNIDGREINRSLLSIKAELRKRQEIFSQYSVNHIDSYIKLYKAGKAERPLPHLILIVDEFAELKSEQPDFMKELISAARIGRSLGVHLILATQKPSGVVDDQIWSNSKFKLCLKVQNKEDSNEVLKSPLAAEIKEPGRAYLQVGNNEIFDLFQSAYSGAPAEQLDEDNQKEFVINTVSLSGKRTPVYSKKKNKIDKHSETQLEAIVDYISGYCRANDVVRLPGICLPPLSERILYSEEHREIDEPFEVIVPIGIYDDPYNQLQEQVILNITQNNTFIVGASQFGKTNMLQTIVRGLSEAYTPKEINIYILDFASMILKSFEDLRHVGGVVTAKNDEKLKNFIKMINNEIATRKEALSKLNLSSFTSYREAGYKEIPQILIMIDNVTAMRELYPDYDDDLLNICREGLAVGISLVIANSQSSGFGYKYLSNFAKRITLYCNDSNEYSNLFDRCRMVPKNIPGRALVEIDKTIYEYQNYLGFVGEKEIDRVRDMRKFIEEINIKYSDEKAKLIPEVPSILTNQYIKNVFNESQLKPYELPIAINYDTVDIVRINFASCGTLAITGAGGRGKSNFIYNLMHRLSENIFNNLAEVYIIDGIDRKLKGLEAYGFVKNYSIDSSEFEIILEDIYSEAEDRYEKMVECGVECLEDMPLIMVIVQNRDAIEAMSTDKNALEKYKKLNSKFKNLRISFVFSDVENIQVGYGAPEIYKLIKENKKTLLFDDISNNKLHEIPIAVERMYKKPIDIGDAYFINGSEIIKIKTVIKD
jgi:S-DNA-T family DNA segregation ATPase FtsK/SpoIIIE